MNNLTGPATRYTGHYYYDEVNGCWFYIFNANPKTNYWTIDLMVHSLTGWKRRNDPMMIITKFDARKFANYPFVV